MPDIYLQLSPTQIGMLFSISGMIVFAMIVPAGFVDGSNRAEVVHGTEYWNTGAVFVLIPLTTSFTQLSTSRRLGRIGSRTLTGIDRDFDVRCRAFACAWKIASGTANRCRVSQWPCPSARRLSREHLQSRRPVFGVCTSAPFFCRTARDSR